MWSISLYPLPHMCFVLHDTNVPDNYMYILLLSPFLRLSLLSLFPFLSLMLVCYTHIFHVCTVVNDWVKSHKLAYLAIPKFISQGRHQHGGLSYRFLVMHCFGEDVEKKFNQCGRQFSIKTVCHLALRIVS